MTAYEVRTGQFRGPLEKLLELIQARALDITAVSLAEVTGDFLKYLGELEGAADPDLLADFALVAAKLVLAKSKTLLPDLALTEEEEHDIHDLEARLALYREFKAREKLFGNAWLPQARSYGRPLFFMAESAPAFYPSAQCVPEPLRAAAEKLTAALRELMPETRRVKSAVVSIREKMQELLTRIAAVPKSSFRDVSRERTRSEVIAMFLAILHLVKQKLLIVEQGDTFGDIILDKQ